MNSLHLIIPASLMFLNVDFNTEFLMLAVLLNPFRYLNGKLILDDLFRKRYCKKFMVISKDF